MYPRSNRLSTPRSSRRGVRWSRILIGCLVFAVATTALMYGHSSPTVAMPVALQPVPPTALDLRDGDVRRALREVVNSPRLGGLGAGNSLFNRCSAYSGDVYAALSEPSFSPALYVEVRRTTAGDATALTWETVHPPRSSKIMPPQRALPSQLLHEHSVKTEDVAAIEAEFLALSQTQTPRVKSQQALDGGSLLLEFCRGGQYGLFLRENVYEDDHDRRIFQLGEQLLAVSAASHRKLE
jgi:hypothetical protein